MDKQMKMKRIKLALLGWLVLASCQMPDFLSDLGRTIGDMFRGFRP